MQIHRRSHVMLRVVAAYPQARVRLTQHSQLAVVPRPRRSPAPATTQPQATPATPCVLRVQHRPPGVDGWQDTCSVVMAAATATWVGVAAGGFVELSAANETHPGQVWDSSRTTLR